jgi:hypothetical protein
MQHNKAPAHNKSPEPQKDPVFSSTSAKLITTKNHPLVRRRFYCSWTIFRNAIRWFAAKCPSVKRMNTLAMLKAQSHV